jgi:hypothetical protein
MHYINKALYYGGVKMKEEQLAKIKSKLIADIFGKDVKQVLADCFKYEAKSKGC